MRTLAQRSFASVLVSSLELPKIIAFWINDFGLREKISPRFFSSDCANLFRFALIEKTSERRDWDSNPGPL